jgi:surface polysaccharide O-acyltransferase-like enzyme
MMGNIVEGFCRTAVSLFFMISGYLNLIHPLPWKEYLKKRLSRLFIILVTWSLIHMLLLVYTGQRQYTLVSAFTAILTGKVYDHLWFLYSLFAFYLLTPLFQKIIEKNVRYLWCLFALWVILEPVGFLVGQFTGFQVLGFIPEGLNYLSYYGYYLLGYLVGSRKFTRRQSWLALGIYFLATFFIIGSTWAMTVSRNSMDTTYYYINGFPVLIGAIGLFIFIKEGNFGHPLVKFFGATTTGVYLMHYIIIDLAKRGLFGIKLSSVNPSNPYIGIPLTSVVVFLVSALITWILLKIPVLRRTVS